MATAPTVMYVNDFDTSRLGLVVRRWDGADGAPTRTAVATAALNRSGRVLMDGRPSMDTRLLLLEATMLHTSIVARQTALDSLKQRLGHGPVEVRFVDRPGVVFLALLRRATEAPPEAGQALEATRFVTLELECLDPYLYETGRQLVALSSTPVRVPLGTVPSPCVIRIFGAATTPTITLRAANGTVLDALSLAVTLGANDALEIDSDRGTITRYIAGTPSEGLSLLSSGNFLVLDPGDGDGTLDGGPTLDVSSGTGDCRWRKAFV